MKKNRKYIGLASLLISLANPVTGFAGWIPEGDTYRYLKDNGEYAVSEWVYDHDVYYYMDQFGLMEAGTTTPDGYLVAPDGSWIADTQVQGGYVKTPYDNAPWRYDADWQRYIFDDATDYAWVTDSVVLAAVRGIIPVSELSDKNKAVYDEVMEFLVGFDYWASDYDKAEAVYDEIVSRASYNHGPYVNADDEVYSVLVNGTGKCVGFARTYKLLANAAGLTCGFREDSTHMWNAVYIDGIPKSIDTSSAGGEASSYLDVSDVICPHCGRGNIFAARETAHPCPGCFKQVYNPKYQ